MLCLYCTCTSAKTPWMYAVVSEGQVSGFPDVHEAQEAVASKSGTFCALNTCIIILCTCKINVQDIYQYLGLKKTLRSFTGVTQTLPDSPQGLRMNVLLREVSLVCPVCKCTCACAYPHAFFYKPHWLKPDSSTRCYDINFMDLPDLSCCCFFEGYPQTYKYQWLYLHAVISFII